MGIFVGIIEVGGTRLTLLSRFEAFVVVSVGAGVVGATVVGDDEASGLLEVVALASLNSVGAGQK